MNLVPCSGVIVFDEKLEKCVIVKTENNNYGFPKGKREKGETFEQNALRELYEETGLTKNKLLFAENVFIDELSRKGNPCTRYMIAKYNHPDKHVFKFDKNELAEVNWCILDEVIDKLEDKRKTVLNSAIATIKNANTNFISFDNI